MFFCLMEKMFHRVVMPVMLAVLLAGCMTTTKNKIFVKDIDDPVWRMETIRDLALDLREDGDIDRNWSDSVPVAVRKELIDRAKTLNENSKGE